MVDHMENKTDVVFLCSCEASFPLDMTAIESGLAASNPASQAPRFVSCSNLCRTEVQKLDTELKTASRITIACQQEQPLFSDVLENAGFAGEVFFSDIRDRAGWSNERAKAGPKMAALIAVDQLPRPALPFVSLESQGVTLIYGRDERAIEVGKRLADALDVTVMLVRPENIMPPRRTDFPIVKGIIRQAKGYMGAFELSVDDFALSLPSSRHALHFADARQGAQSRCDLVIDLSGGTPLFAADSLRDGYLRCDPNDALAVERLIARARDLVGIFDKPKYIAFQNDLCVHSRSQITGCRRCLDVCPTGAISPQGDRVTIDPAICAGCGGCASVCPTGAASYALPSADVLMRRLRLLLRTYTAAGGKDAIVLFHDSEHGGEMLDAMARATDGLPAHVIPLEVNELTQIGIEQIAAGFAYGAAGLAFLSREKPKHDLLPLNKTLALAQAILPALGQPSEAVCLIGEDDPDAVLRALNAMPRASTKQAASFLPMGNKRSVMMLALREWHSHAPQQPERIALPASAPFGKVNVKAEACTLCLACVSTCPTHALSANPERPELRFQEDLCVQCGLCASTCPEKVIQLEPQLDFSRINGTPVTLKEEEPYACDNCGTLFGTKSTIERIKSKLAGAHWMYSGSNADRIKLIGYCDTCRIEVATTQGFDPYGGPERPRVRTSEDYFKEREKNGEND